MKIADLVVHYRVRTLRILAGDMAFLRGVMGLTSLGVVVVLLLPGETLGGNGFQIFGRYLTDWQYAIPFLVHAAGMTRQNYQVRERPHLDFWMNVLGSWLFLSLGIEVMVSLNRPTLQGWLWILTGLAAAWGAVRSGNGVDGARRR